MAYLNHAGTSWPKPEPVQRAVESALRSDPCDWPDDFDRQHRRVAEGFGVRDQGRLLLTPGCTQALSLAIADHAWIPGDRIVTSRLEHHAVQRPVALLERAGVEPVRIPRATDGPFDLDVLADVLRAGSVRVVAVTAACNVTGELLPVTEIATLAHEHGALCLVDAAQTAGWLPYDLSTLGVDLFAFAGHKGLQGPWGLGGLYVAPHVALSSPAAACELPEPGEPVACATMPGYCDAGSVDRTALAGLVAALGWLASPERTERLARARRQVERFAGALEQRPDARVLGMRSAEARLPTLAFAFEHMPLGDAASAFSRAGVTVAAGLQCAPLAHEELGTAPAGTLRLSAGPATGDAEIDRALSVLAEL